MAMVDSFVILLGEGIGEFGVNSILSITGGVEVLTFFCLPFFVPKSTNHLNWILTDTLFVAASSRMSTAVASSYSSYSNSDKISLHFPFSFP